MDSSKKHINHSPEVSANIVSRLFFCWFLPFFKYGYKKDLDIKDIYNATKEDLSAPLGDVLERNWNLELLKRNKNDPKDKPSLEKVIFKTFYKPYSLYGISLFLQCVVLRFCRRRLRLKSLNVSTAALIFSNVVEVLFLTYQLKLAKPGKQPEY